MKDQLAQDQKIKSTTKSRISSSEEYKVCNIKLRRQQSKKLEATSFKDQSSRKRRLCQQITEVICQKLPATLNVQIKLEILSNQIGKLSDQRYGH